MRHPSCRPNRREFLGAGLLGTLALALSPAAQRLFAADAPARRARACILIWLNGGPSHLDTFDPKPDAPPEVRGTFQTIETRVAGLRLPEHLPKLAAQADKLAVVRSLTSPEADHDRAYRFIHTGNLADDTLEYPSLGSVLAREKGGEAGDLPPFVALNGGFPSAGFFGADFEPHFVVNLDAPLDNVALPEGVDESRLGRRAGALATLNQTFGKKTDPERVAEQERLTEKALRFRKSPALKAFDLSAEKAATLAGYGVPESVPEGQALPTFGRACVMARRLVEAGVKFVEVTLDGWDTHADNFNLVAALLKELDPALAGLTADLADRGLLDSTLVMCLGEFGRTPVINAASGRDHHSKAFSAVLAGGGVKGGQVIGASDARGE